MNSVWLFNIILRSSFLYVLGICLLVNVLEKFRFSLDFCRFIEFELVKLGILFIMVIFIFLFGCRWIMSLLGGRFLKLLLNKLCGWCLK